MIASMALLGFVFNACNNDLEFVEEGLSSGVSFSTTRANADQMFGLFETDFLAGQKIKAGTVSIWNDYDNVFVKFATKDGWQIRRTHLFIGPKEILLDPANGYVNKNGSPKNGHFPYGEYFDPFVTEWVFSLPLTELYAMFGLDFDMEVDVCPIIAAHAEVLKLKEDGTWQEETAWGDGTKFVKKGNWSMYVEGYCTEFPPEDPPTPPTEYKLDEETAWAYESDEFSYGTTGNWAKFIEYKGESTTVYLMAGKGNVTEMTVTLTPTEDGMVKMVFDEIYEIAPENDGKWVLQDVTNNIKIQGYAEAPYGMSTAPGQFDNKFTGLDNVVVPAANFYGIHLDVAKLTYIK